MTNRTVKYEELNVEDIIFTNFEDNMYVKSQRVSQIYYQEEGDLLSIQTPEFYCEAYGIPKASDFYDSEKSRSFYKLPLAFERGQYPEINYEAIKTLYDKMVEIDNHCNTDAFREKMFGKTASKYEYIPLVRHPDENENNVKYYNPPYMKIKLHLDNLTNKPNFSAFSLKDGKREKIELNSFEDVLQHFKYMSKHRFVVRFQKMYAMKTAMGGSNKKKYGIVLKLMCAECANKPARNLDRHEDLFLDD